VRWRGLVDARRDGRRLVLQVLPRVRPQSACVCGLPRGGAAGAAPPPVRAQPSHDRLCVRRRSGDHGLAPAIARARGGCGGAGALERGAAAVVWCCRCCRACGRHRRACAACRVAALRVLRPLQCGGSRGTAACVCAAAAAITARQPPSHGHGGGGRGRGRVGARRGGRCLVEEVPSSVRLPTACVCGVLRLRPCGRCWGTPPCLCAAAVATRAQRPPLCGEGADGSGGSQSVRDAVAPVSCRGRRCALASAAAADGRVQVRRPPTMLSSMRARRTITRTAAASRHAQVWRRPPRTSMISGGRRMSHKWAAAAAGGAFCPRQAHGQVRPTPPRGDGVSGGRRRTRTSAAAADDVVINACSANHYKDGGRQPTCTSVAAAAAHVHDQRWPPHVTQVGGGGRWGCVLSTAGARTSAPAATARGWRPWRPPPDAYKCGGRRRCRHQCVLGERLQGRRPPADMHKCGGGRRVCP